jgi:hypothetical protein
MFHEESFDPFSVAAEAGPIFLGVGDRKLLQEMFEIATKDYRPATKFTGFQITLTNFLKDRRAIEATYFTDVGYRIRERFNSGRLRIHLNTLSFS